MKIYFRAKIQYDIRRSGIDSIDFDYSLMAFDKTIQPLTGIYEFSEYEIPDNYTLEMATSLCEKMISNYNRNGVSLATTLKNELSK